MILVSPPHRWDRGAHRSVGPTLRVDSYPVYALTNILRTCMAWFTLERTQSRLDALALDLFNPIHGTKRVPVLSLPIRTERTQDRPFSPSNPRNIRSLRICIPSSAWSKPADTDSNKRFNTKFQDTETGKPLLGFTYTTELSQRMHREKGPTQCAKSAARN
ncbi:hypothetical protein BDM02DRAFT_3108016 [Thelephora ganbajun]|uniref:Uncharacterized protein n=1 Tax=Thelephora ganbajun TaxID=370292 RepID=A0ACB6ZUQ3_THEGA|nr:hypothetical protein BDM02DRAFT_3108016 [Thelephora ganbajun]